MRLGSSFSSTVCTKGRAFSRSSGRLPPAAPVTNVQTGQSFLLYLVNPFSSEARKNTLPFVYLTDANATPLLRELRISLGWTEIIKKKPDGRKYCNRNQRFTTWQMREEDVRNKQEKPPGCTMQLLLGAWLGPKAGKVNEEVLIFSESDIWKDVGQRCCQRCALQESLDVRTCFPCWAENSMCLGSVQAGCEGSCWAGSLDGAEALLPLTAEAL
eukprot:XP_027311862.1 uncharacterized protein LOC110351363 isoform X2 [Anas platyrhynchos]